MDSVLGMATSSLKLGLKVLSSVLGLSATSRSSEGFAVTAEFLVFLNLNIEGLNFNADGILKLP